VAAALATTPGRRRARPAAHSHATPPTARPIVRSATAKPGRGHTPLQPGANDRPANRAPVATPPGTTAARPASGQTALDRWLAAGRPAPAATARPAPHGHRCGCAAANSGTRLPVPAGRSAGSGAGHRRTPPRVVAHAAAVSVPGPAAPARRTLSCGRPRLVVLL